jgi:hypothetical protein
VNKLLKGLEEVIGKIEEVQQGDVVAAQIRLALMLLQPEIERYKELESLLLQRYHLADCYLQALIDMRQAEIEVEAPRPPLVQA